MKKLNEELIYEYINEIRLEILPHSEDIMRESRFVVFEAINKLLNISVVARIEGLEAIHKLGEQLEKSSSYLDRFIAVELKEENIVYRPIISMIEEYYSVDRNVSERFIMYIYIRGMVMIECGMPSIFIKRFCKSMIPINERGLFDKYICETKLLYK